MGDPFSFSSFSHLLAFKQEKLFLMIYYICSIIYQTKNYAYVIYQKGLDKKIKRYIVYVVLSTVLIICHIEYINAN